MEKRNKFILGFLTIMILVSGIVYITFDNTLRLRVDNDKSTFYVLNDNDRWIVAGREYNSIFDGSSKLNRKLNSISVDTEMVGDYLNVVRSTSYKNNITIIDSYLFNPNTTAIEQFPISHTVRVLNGKGYFYRYEVRDLEYSGDTVKLNTNSFSFGNNMKVTFDSGYRWAWVYSTGILKVQYDIPTNDYSFNVRLFDPPASLLLEGIDNDITAELGSIINVSSTGTDTICIDVDHPQGGINVSCGTSHVEYELNITYMNKNIFNNSATYQEIEPNIEYTANSFTRFNATFWLDSDLTTFFGLSSSLFDVLLYNSSNYGNLKTTDVLITYPNGTEILFGFNSSCLESMCDTNPFGVGFIDTGIYLTLYCKNGGTFSCGKVNTNILYSEEIAEVRLVDLNYQVANIDVNKNDEVIGLSFDVDTSNIDYSTFLYTYLNDTLVSTNYLVSAIDSVSDSFDSGSASKSQDLTVNTLFSLGNFTVPVSVNSTNFSLDLTGTSIEQSVSDLGYNSLYSVNSKLTDLTNLNNNLCISGVDTTGSCGYSYASTENMNYATYTDYEIEVPNNITSINISYSLITFSGYIATDIFYNVQDYNYTYYVYNYTSSDYILIDTSSYNFLSTGNGTGSEKYKCSTNNFIINLNDDYVNDSKIRLRYNIDINDGNIGKFKAIDKISYSCGSSSYVVAPSINPSLGGIFIDYSFIGYPSNFYIELGSLDGSNDYNYTDILNSTATVDLTTVYNEELITCDSDNDGFCTLPLYLASQSVGNILVDNINLNLTSFNPTITINSTTVSNYVNNLSTDTGTIPLTFETQRPVVFNITNLNYNYRGGNETVEVKAHTTDYSTNLTHNITYYYSDFEIVLPTNIEYIEFIPRSSKSQDVGAYGQTATVPIFNITSTATGGKGFDLFLYNNDTINDNCVKLSFTSANTNLESSIYSGLIAYYPLDLGAINTMNNDSSYTVTGAIESEGKLGNAYWFDGVDDNIAIEHKDYLNITGDITISLWAYSSSDVVGTTIDAIVSKGDYDGGLDDGASYYINYNSNSNLHIYGFVDTTDNKIYETFTYSIEDTFHNLVYVRNSTHNVIYIDGIFRAADDYSTTPISNSIDLTIGEERTTRNFKGFIDNVMIWNRSLSSSEIETLYERQNNTYYDIYTTQIEQLAIHNQSYSDSAGVWAFTDYNCTNNGWLLFNPNLYFKACCIGCNVCGEVVK